MPISKKTYQPVQAITVKAVQDLPAFRFVSHLGSLCDADTRALGIAETRWVSGENAAIVTLGTILLETNGTITAGQDLTSDASGKAKVATGTLPVNARAIDTCTGAGFVKVKIVP